MRGRLAQLTVFIHLYCVALASAGAQEPPKDFTSATPESLGVELVKPHKDPKTGFMVGGKNVTAIIGKLTEIAEQPIAKLEKRMRPGADSKMGFLGKEESLLEVLAMDNRLVVDEWKLTHQELAKHLHLIGAITAKNAVKMPFEFRYHGKTFRAEATFSRGIQQSPFDDETKTNCNATIENLGSKKKFTFSLLVPHMIERYGFYEGKGTPYRVDPRVIVEALDFIKPAKGDARVGASSVKITPPLGTPMAGYYYARAAEGVHDDLFAKTLVLEQDGIKAALVSLDLISTTPALVKEARQEIERITKIKGADVMISATHAHTGPVLSARGVRDTFLGGGSDLAQRYNAELPAKIAQAVKQADDALSSVRILAGAGKEDSIAFNRRFFMKDGTVGWNPGILNPNIVKPAGTIDPEVPVVYFESAEKKPIATYVNYAVHLDNVGGLQFSADLPYTVGKLLAEVKGPGMVTVYTTGTCGDVNHVNVNWGEKQRGHENAARMGIILAGEVLRTFPKLKPISGSALRSKNALVQLPLPKLESGDLEKAKATVQAIESKKGKPPSFLEQVHAFKVLDVAAREGKPNEVEVQVIALGDDIAWVSLPGEIFVELGIALKKGSPFRHTIIAELANGSVGYVPSRRAYPQGNYEVVSARCAEGSGEMLVETALKLLKELHAK